jgi:hypothetical protein
MKTTSIIENRFFAWMNDVIDKTFLKYKCNEEEPDAWRIYWLNDTEECIYSYTAYIFIRTKAGHYWYIDLYYYAYEERLNAWTKGSFESLEAMKADYETSPPDDLPFPDDLAILKSNPKKRINLEEKQAELTKRLWYDIAHQDSFYVYIDKDGNVYDDKGGYMETIELTAIRPSIHEKFDNS